MKISKIINILMGTNNMEEDTDNGAKAIESVVARREDSNNYVELGEEDAKEEQIEDEYIGELPESTVRDIFEDLYSQLNIKPTQTIYRIFIDGWKDGLVNIETTTVKDEISAPKNMEEFDNLCLAFKGMLEEQLNEVLDINFVRGYCYCLCFFMPNK